MIDLCEIMEFVTEEKNILHLDIKPENIMVTRYGKELVLIDFGRAKKITKANRFVKSPLSDVNYNDNETVDRMYQYGTLGYAALNVTRKLQRIPNFLLQLILNREKCLSKATYFLLGPLSGNVSIYLNWLPK